MAKGTKASVKKGVLSDTTASESLSEPAQRRVRGLGKKKHKQTPEERRKQMADYHQRVTRKKESV